MSESLYRQHLHKHAQESFKHQLHPNSIKVTAKSNHILTQKLFNELERFPDQDLISVTQSIPILYAMNILQVLKSVEEVKAMLNSQQQPINCSRLKMEAKFISHLWKAIAHDSLPCLELKKIIYLFHLKKGSALQQILKEMFESQQDAHDLYTSWNELQNDKLYYRHPNGKEKLKTQEDLNSTWSEQKKFQRIKSYSKSKIVLKQKSKQKPTQKQKKRSKLSRSKFNSTVSNFSKSNEENQPIFDRLYETQFYSKKEQLKEEHQKEKERQALMQCTFKPHTNNGRILERSRSSSVEVKGYEKTISRLKEAHKRQAEDKEKNEHIPTGENYENLRKKSLNPPSFLSRKKEQGGEHLFSIGLEIGSKKAVLKIRSGDTAESAGSKICQIYGLNRRFQVDLEELIQKEMDNYWAQQA